MKTFGIVLAVWAGLIVLALAAFLVAKIPGSTEEIEAVADSYPVDESWLLASEQIVPPRILCFDSVPCPSVQRHYVLPAAVSMEDFTERARSMGLDTIEGDCVENEGRSVQTACHAHGTVGGFEVTVDSVIDHGEPRLKVEVGQ
ncbi:hypothetical protein OH146_08600 [Salinibacterium sp. SYSU T00001]|uniref:hypothetical protein n=1 Tax=Homoserinimonas sedimenticola TaxID=2986805 RepID=UPI0022357129|nr:hypothetical protein [Salinibacterium sedimenticola]MCW4385831.1 hypothetical protein [Salinibacterium sedimenticola]